MKMTEEQIRKRMAEIDAERNKLAEEKREYEQYLENLETQEKKNLHEVCIGKCYVSNGSKQNQHDYVKAFKVLNLSEDSDSDAWCLVLIDGLRSTCYEEFGIQKMMLGLWKPNQPRLKPDKGAPKVMDFYYEVSQERFNQLYSEFLHVMEEDRLQ